MFSLTHHRRQKRMRLSPNRPGFAFTLREKWDFEVLGQILARKSSMLDEDGKFDHQLKDLLQQVYDVAPRHKGAREIFVDYFAPPKAIPYLINGRVFGPGLQRAPGWVRRLCSHKYYHDVDIVNCFPVLLLQLQEKVGVTIDPVNLRRYVAEREAVLAEDMAQIPGLTRKEAKSQYLKVMFGSNELQYKTSFLLQYKNEIEYIREHLWHMSEYRPMKDYAESNRREQPNVKSSFLSLVITTVERTIVETAMRRMEEDDIGYKVDTYVFDGFMVRKKPSVDEIPAHCFELLKSAVEEKTGYSVSFIEKSLKPQKKDIERLRPSFNNIDNRNTWDPNAVFVELDLQADILNRDPKPENVELFTKALIPIMNKAFAYLKGTATLVLTRSVDLTKGPNHVKYTRAKKAEVKAGYDNYIYFINNGEKRIKIVPINIWLKSPFALSYSSIVFNPRPYSHPLCATPFELNSYVGIAHPQKQRLTQAQCRALEQNELKPFWDHVKNIWCCGDEPLYTYVRNWIWSKVTRPWFRVETALVLQSKEGAGKGIVLEKVCEILGLQYMSKPSSLEQITGNTFNKQYFECCLVMFLDEAFYAGSKATKNQVKTLITDRWVTVNEKFMPKYRIENYSSMALASNENHVINTDVTTRRFVVMKCSNELAGVHAEDSEQRRYFNRVINTDPQLLSDYLHSIEGAPQWTGRDIPRTLAMEDQAILSFSKLETFVHDIMRNPDIIQGCRVDYLRVHPRDRINYEFDEDRDPLEGLYVKSALYKYFQDNYKGGFQATNRELFRYLEEHIADFLKNASTRPRIEGIQERTAKFPKIAVAREQYKRAKGFRHITFE